MKKGSEFDSPLQTVHLCFLKGVLGVKELRLTGLCCKSVDRSLCSFYCFHAAAKRLTLYLARIVTCSRRLCMQILLSVLLTKCAGLRSSEKFEGLRASDRYTN